MWGLVAKSLHLRSEWRPSMISSFSRSMPANGLNAEPVVARQFEQ
jgi:hypothetical protein